MKTRKPGNFIPFSLMWAMYFILFITASGCATSRTINPPEKPDTVSYMSANQGDHVLISTKDDQKLDIIVTEINSERKILIGRPVSQPKYSYYKPIAVNFSDIEDIETKQSKPPNRDDDLDEPKGPLVVYSPGISDLLTWEHFRDALFAGFCGPLCYH
jgi:hypothetical protein